MSDVNSFIDQDLANYVKNHGPEPVIDRKKPDLERQYRHYCEWWLEWYRLPLTVSGDPCQK